MKLLTFSLICILSLALVACQRDEGVQAGREDGTTGTYQPRPAPNVDTDIGAATMGTQEIKGQFVRVDNKSRTLLIRLENGMEQTIKFDENTTVSGTGMDQSQKQDRTQQMNQIRNLKPGSELTIRWRGDAADKMASSITVTSMKKSGSDHSFPYFLHFRNRETSGLTPIFR